MVQEAAEELAAWLAEAAEGAAAGAATPPYAELEHATHAAYLASLPGDRIAVGDGFAVRTGVDSNAENGVVCSALDGDPAEVIAWLGDAPAQWLVGPGSDLRERLVQAGCRAERTAVVMGARLSDLDLRTPEGEPADAADFGEDRAVGAQARFVVRRDGRAVGIVSTFTHDDTIEVLELAVLADHRRHGIGRALMARALQGAPAFVVLGPTPDSIPFYRRLGFELRPALRDRCFYLPARTPAR
jgi:GNAT superfamily N-acetyltransferase